MLARAGIDPLYPQRAKVTLAVAPVAIGVAQCLLDLFDRDAIRSAAAPAVALGEIENLLVAGVGRNPALDACQGLIPSCKACRSGRGRHLPSPGSLCRALC